VFIHNKKWWSVCW